MLDVGAGEGLLGLAAVQHVAPAGSVILSDASTGALQRARAEAAGHGDRVRTVEADAVTLEPIADGSVDAVVLRSVLIYVRERGAALRAFRRVLRPSGRLSLFEPLAGRPTSISNPPSVRPHARSGHQPRALARPRQCGRDTGPRWTAEATPHGVAHFRLQRSR